MFWSQLKTIIWLQFRLRINAAKRHGTFAQTLNLLFMIAIVGSGVIGFFAALIAGIMLLPKVNADQLLAIWLGIMFFYGVFWTTGVATDIQRTDSTSLEKLMHLPMKPKTAFWVNYLSSYANLMHAWFLPVLLGLSIAQVVVLGPRMLLVFPLLLCFIVMVNTVTYQLRGWIATLMVDKRRRRMIMSLSVLVFIGLSQVPNLFNIYWMRTHQAEQDKISEEREQATEELEAKLQAGEINSDEFQQQIESVYENDSAKSSFSIGQTVKPYLKFIRYFPPVWVADGVTSAFRGNFLPGLLQSLASVLISAVSFGRSYRTTVRFYRGEFTAGSKKSAKSADTIRKKSGPTRALRIANYRIPFCNESVSSVASSSFLGLIRAPEARMGFAVAVIMLVVFSGLLISGGIAKLASFARPLVPLGLTGMMVFFIIQVSGNQFGFDRQGFRLFVLSPIKKRDVLLGKNLALAPFVVGVAIVLAVALQIPYPMAWTHLLATIPQAMTIFLVGCLATNLMSIVAPMRVSPGSIRKNNPGIVAVLKQFCCMLLMQIGILPILIPWGADAYLTLTDRNPYGVPVYLILAIILFLVTGWAYLKLLEQEGKLLAKRQEKILEVVTREEN